MEHCKIIPTVSIEFADDCTGCIAPDNKTDRQTDFRSDIIDSKSSSLCISLMKDDNS